MAWYEISIVMSILLAQKSWLRPVKSRRLYVAALMKADVCRGMAGVRMAARKRGVYRHRLPL